MASETQNMREGIAAETTAQTFSEKTYLLSSTF